MGYVKRRLRPANGNFHSRVLRPVAKKGRFGLWVSGLLFVIGAAALGLFYMRDARRAHSAKTYRYDMVRVEPTRAVRPLEKERWGQPKSVPGGSIQNNEAVQLFRDMGFRESTSRAMAEEFERNLQYRIGNSAW